MFSLIQEYDNNFKEIFDNSFDYMYLHDLEGNILDINNIVVENLGYSREEIHFMKVTDFLSTDENIYEITEAIKNTIQTGEVSKPRIYKVKSKIGEIVYLEVNTIPLKKNGAIYAILGIGHDVTQYKKIEQRLRDSEKRYKHLFKQSPYSISIFDSKGILIESNQNLIHKLEVYLKEDFTGKNFIEIIKYFENSAQLTSLFSERFKSLRKGAILDPIEFPLITKSGRKIWLYWQSSIIKIDNEKFIQVIIRDITDIKESDKLFRTLFENARDGILVADTKTLEFHTGNKKICEMLGYSLDEIKKLSVKDIHPEDELDLVLKQFKKVVNGELSSTRYTPMKKKSGAIFYCEINASKIDFGGRTYLMGIFRDITEYRLAEEKLKFSEEKFHTLFNNSSSGIAYHKIIYGEIGTPIDYIITDINPQYEKILPLHKDDVLDKKATEVYQTGSAPYLDIYSKVADTGKTTSFEAYIPQIDKHFRISVISPKKGEFISVFDDISERKIAEFKLKERNENLSTLNKIISLGNESTNLQEFLKKSYDQVLEILGLDMGGIYLYEKETQHNKLVFAKNVHPDFVTAVEDVDISDGLFNKVFDKNKPSYIEDFSKFMEGSKELGVYSVVIVPLRAKDEYVGSMNIGSPDHQVFSKIELDLLDAIGKQMGIVIQKFKSEKLLKESEEKFRTIAEQSFMGIIVLQDGVFKYFNERAAEIYGYTVEEIKNWKPNEFSKLIHPDDKEFVINQARKKQAGDKDVINHHQYRLIKKSGETIWVENYSKTINYKGKLADLVMTVDITDKIKSDIALKESEEKFRTITEQSLIGIIILQDDVIKYGNQRVVDILGYSIEEFKSWGPKEFIKIFHPDSRQLIIEQAEKKQRGASDVLNHYSAKFLNNTGATIWLDVFSKTIPYQGGLADFITFYDITERKKAEQELIESEKILKDFIQNATDSISIWDSNLNLIEMNKVAADPWNPAKETEIGMNMLKVGPSIKETERYRKYIEVIKTGEPVSFDNVRIPPNTGERYFNIKSFKVGNGIGIIGSEITERIRFEQELKESEEKFRTIAEQSFMSIGILQDDVFKYVNQRFIYMVEYSLDEITRWKPREFLKIIHPDYRKKMEEQARKKQQGHPDVVANYQFRGLRKSGEVFWAELFSKTINFKGRTADLITVLDITDMKLAEIKLKESEEKYRKLFEDSPIALMEQDYSGTKDYLDLLKASGITDFEKYFDENPEELTRIMFSPKNKIINVNKKFLEVYQANSKEDLILRMMRRFKDKKIINDEVLLYNKKEILSLIEGETIYESESISKTLTGDTINLYVKTSIMPGFESTWSKVIVSLIDITENKISENKLKESEEKFRTISEQSFMGIVIAKEGKLKYLNKAMSKIAGYSVEDMLNWTERDITKMIHPEDVGIILNRWKSNREGTVSDFSHNAFRIINREGETRWLEDYTSKIIYKGKVANLISLVDVTDKMEAEKLILEENKRLLELHELRKDLITRVSHELKTPMTSIYGSIQILLSIFKERIDKDIMNYVEIGYRGCLRLKQLIENLLDTSRLESKKLELNLEKTNLGTLISECVEEMMYLGNLRNITMREDLPNEIYFTLDHLRFRQVLTNLISNAIKNTPKGGKVFINFIEKNDYIDINVRDTGVGLTITEKERLFEKFGKIERYGMDLDVDIEGVGIGLHIAKEITELHGGQILVQSEGRNKGATFTVRLFKKL